MNHHYISWTVFTNDWHQVFIKIHLLSFRSSMDQKKQKQKLMKSETAMKRLFLFLAACLKKTSAD